MFTPLSRTTDVRTSRAGGQHAAQQRRGGIPADEALALAHLRRYTTERRQALHGRGQRHVDPKNRAGRNSSPANRYDAALIRCIDFANALNTLDPLESTILQLVYCDGETVETAAAAVGKCARTVQDRLPVARRALLLALEERNLL